MTSRGTPTPVQAIDHVAMAVADADSSAAWYTEHLGLVVSHDETLPPIGVRLVHLSAPGATTVDSTLQLVQPVGPGAVDDHLRTNGEGLHHVCLSVDDLVAFLAERPDQHDVVPFVGGGGRPCAFLAATPEGTRIELLGSAAGDGVAGLDEALR